MENMKSILKGIVTAFVTLSFTTTVLACPWCRAQVRSDIYNQDFINYLFVIILPIVVITAIGFGVYHADKISNRIRGKIK